MTSGFLKFPLTSNGGYDPYQMQDGSGAAPDQVWFRGDSRSLPSESSPTEDPRLADPGPSTFAHATLRRGRLRYDVTPPAAARRHRV